MELGAHVASSSVRQGWSILDLRFLIQIPSILPDAIHWSGQRCKSQNACPNRSNGVPDNLPAVGGIQEVLPVWGLPFFSSQVGSVLWSSPQQDWFHSPRWWWRSWTLPRSSVGHDGRLHASPDPPSPGEPKAPPGGRYPRWVDGQDRARHGSPGPGGHQTHVFQSIVVVAAASIPGKALKRSVLPPQPFCAAGHACVSMDRFLAEYDLLLLPSTHEHESGISLAKLQSPGSCVYHSGENPDASICFHSCGPADTSRDRRSISCLEYWLFCRQVLWDG